jgi:hypothetical protein
MNGKAIVTLLVGVAVVYYAVVSKQDEHAPAPFAQQSSVTAGESESQPRPEATGSRNDQSADEQLAQDSTSQEVPARQFGGHTCTGDCSGHEAGYNWAEEHAIDDEDDCEKAGDTSNSPSFAEGCKAYVSGDSSTDDDDEKSRDQDSDQGSEDPEP